MYNPHTSIEFLPTTEVTGIFFIPRHCCLRTSHMLSGGKFRIFSSRQGHQKILFWEELSSEHWPETRRWPLTSNVSCCFPHLVTFYEGDILPFLPVLLIMFFWLGNSSLCLFCTESSRSMQQETLVTAQYMQVLLITKFQSSTFLFCCEDRNAIGFMRTMHSVFKTTHRTCCQ